MSRIDVEYWAITPSTDGDLFGDSVRPVLDAGQADLVDPPFAVTDEVVAEPTPGHSPGHVSVRIRSGGARSRDHRRRHAPPGAVRPAGRGRRSSTRTSRTPSATRRAFLAEHADRDVLVIGTHFADPVAGHIAHDGDAYRFD